MNISGAYNLVRRMKVNALVMAQRSIAKSLAKLVVTEIDTAAVNGNETSGRSLGDAYTRITSEENVSDCDLILFPDGDKTLLLIYTVSRDIAEMIESNANVHDYAYGDASDHPEDISEKDWKARGAHWTRILGPSGIPAAHGLTFKLVNEWETRPPTVEEILAEVPTFEQRVNEMAFYLYTSAVLDELAKERGHPAKPGEMLRIVSECRTDPDKEKLDAAAKTARAQLKRNLSVKDISQA